MHDEHDIARIARLLADPARARILRSLADGTTRPAGELAYAAGVSAQSASGHLARLAEGGLILAEAQGRHRYFRIASAGVSAAVEELASLGRAGRPRAPRPPLPSPSVPAQFLNARTCYGHLAGKIAVEALAGMLKARWLAADGRDYTVTRLGEARLAGLGIDVAAARRGRRVFARSCVDLTQRRPHLGGALGDALLDACVARGWIRRDRPSRVVRITRTGHEGFRRLFRP